MSDVDRPDVVARAEQAIEDAEAYPDGANIAALAGATRRLMAEVERLRADGHRGGVEVLDHHPEGQS